jgi:hypothetical protein
MRDLAFSPTALVVDLPSCSVVSMRSVGALIGSGGAGRG